MARHADLYAGIGQRIHHRHGPPLEEKGIHLQRLEGHGTSSNAAIASEAPRLRDRITLVAREQIVFDIPGGDSTPPTILSKPGQLLVTVTSATG